MKFLQLLLAIVIGAWVLAVLGVPGIRDAFAARGVPTTWDGVYTLNAAILTQVFGWIDARQPWVSVIAGTVTMLTLFVKR